MRTATSLRPRVDRSSLTVGILAGDLVAITLLAAIGVAHHQGVGRLADPAYVALVAAPFAIGWLAVAVAGSLYTADAVSSPVGAAIRAAPAWVVAALIGQAVRATEFFPGNTGPVFALVTIVAGGTLIVVWRVLASLGT